MTDFNLSAQRYKSYIIFYNSITIFIKSFNIFVAEKEN